MKEQFKMKPVRTGVLLATLAFSLNACMATQSRDGSSASAQSTTQQAPLNRSEVPTGEVSAVQEITPINIAEQQRLIDEINRTGITRSVSGYREPVPAAVAPQGEDVVELNYEQADLRLVLEELADALDISILIDPTIDDKISIRTSENRPLNRADIWPLIRMLTRDAGITLQQVGGVYNARKLVSSIPVEIATPDNIENTSAAVIMQITPLVYVTAESVRELIGPLIPEGAITKLTNTNVLAVSGTVSELERINQLLLLIDSDPFATQGIHIYELSNAGAAEVATELQDIINLIEGQNPAYKVKGIERINALLVTAPAGRGFDEITRWVQILDADSQEQVEQLFHYRVKNLNAMELAATLSSVFEDDKEDRTTVPTAAAETPASPLASLPGATENTATANTPAAAGNASAPEPAATGATTIVSANLRVKIVADESTNSLLIRSSARDYRQLLTTINQLDSVPLQVMVNAVIAQVTLTDDTKFGVDWSRVANNAAVDDISTSTSTAFLPGSATGLLFNKTFIDGAARVEATLEAIAANNEVRLLARPALTVVNNQEGEIQIGAEVPVEQGETLGSGGVSTTNIQYRPTGIELYITPQINDDGIVNLNIRQVLSSVDNSGLGVNNNPVFNNQEISTTVVVRDGENVVLGGLIQTENEQLNSGVPFLNRVPVLKGLFSYQQDLQERRELFIVLRPEIINLNNRTSIQYQDILDRFEMAAEMFEEAGIR